MEAEPAARCRDRRRRDAAAVGAELLARLLLLLAFGMKLGWLPVVGYVPLTEDFRQGLLYIVLPITTLA
jgi:ABC-type dipeptide/oligopeptide/nickel transport system permease component